MLCATKRETIALLGTVRSAGCECEKTVAVDRSALRRIVGTNKGLTWLTHMFGQVRCQVIEVWWVWEHCGRADGLVAG